MFEPESRIIRQLCIVNTTTSKTADSICEVWRRSLKQLFCGRQRFVRIIIPWYPLVWVLHGQNKLFQECFFRIIPGKLFLGVTRTLEYLFKGAAIEFLTCLKTKYTSLIGTLDMLDQDSPSRTLATSSPTASLPTPASTASSTLTPSPSSRQAAAADTLSSDAEPNVRLTSGGRRQHSAKVVDRAPDSTVARASHS